MDTKKTPREGRIERKKKQTRQRIIDVAIKLFESQGFSNTTIEQIAEEADLARKTLYNHFSDKDAIVDQYVRDISQGLARETLKNLQNMPDTKTRLLVALTNAYQWVEINPELTKVALGYRLKSLYQNSGEYEETGTQSIVAQIIKQGQEEGEIRHDIPIKLLVSQIDVLRSSIVFDWMKDTAKFQLREEIVKIVDLFLYGAVGKNDKKL